MSISLFVICVASLVALDIGLLIALVAGSKQWREG